jgi:two-component system LytT family response regulator
MQISNPPTELIAIKINCGFEYVSYSMIIRIEADLKHTLIYINNEERVILSEYSITDIELILPRTMFFRCHRSHIINLRYLKKFEKDSHTLYLINNHIVSISKERVLDFLKTTNSFLLKNNLK